MKKTIFLVILVIVVLVAAWLFTKSKPAGEYVVRIGNIPIAASKLPLEIAQQKGFFKEAGINVKVTELQSSNLIADALIRGDIDVTPEISILPFVNAQLIDPGKLKVFSVTDLTIDKQFDSIIVKSDSRISSLADLKGKKIGTFSGTTATNMLKLLFKEKGIDYSGIQFIQLPPTEQLNALSAGSIDALFAYEPTLSIGLSEGAKKIYGSVYAQQVNHNPLGGGFVTTKFINEHPAEAKKVVEALNKAYDYIKTNDQEARQINQDLFKLKPEVASKVALPYLNYSNNIDKGVLDKLLTLFVSAGEIKSKPDMTNAFYQP